jgi:hypothetical protein
MGPDASDNQQKDVGQGHEQRDAQNFGRPLSPTVAGVHVHLL